MSAASCARRMELLESLTPEWGVSGPTRRWPRTDPPGPRPPRSFWRRGGCRAKRRARPRVGTYSSFFS
jgi:hypothetical protein